MGACMSSSSSPSKPKNPPKPKPVRALSPQPHRNSQGVLIEFKQHILLPSYFYPGCSNWAETIKSASAVGMCIINPNSGPGKRADPNYVSQSKAAQNAGIKILGYVPTQYGKRDLLVIRAEIDKYFEWYNVDGIFLDEIPSSRSFINNYEKMRDQIASHKGAITVINPGTHPYEGFFAVADIVCNFEDGYHNYVSTYSTPEWIIKNEIPPERILHIVHSVPGIDQLQQVIGLSRMRRAGHVFITSEKMPNPYGRLPQSAFWEAKTKEITSFNSKPSFEQPVHISSCEDTPP